MATLYGPADSGGGHGDSNRAQMTQIQSETPGRSNVRRIEPDDDGESLAR
jgi:hypothetical protein